MKRIVAAILALMLAAPAMSVASPPLTTASLDSSPVDADNRADGPIIGADTPSRPSARPPAPASTANPLWAIPLATLTETRERPLFSPSRRPPPPPPERAAHAPRTRPPPRPTLPERPHLSLVGTIVGDASGFGLFIDPATKRAIRLKIGHAYRGWVLRTVREREVVLEKNHLDAILSLPKPGQGKTAAPRHFPGPRGPAGRSAIGR